MTTRPETIKSLEQNIEGKLIDVGLGIEFLGLTPKQRQQKENKHVKLYPTEKTETNSKIKRQLKEQKKISANYTSDMRLRNLYNSNGNPLQYSCLENSMDRGCWWATVHGVAKHPTRLK